jgi:iron complex outermembrane receptor protein
MSRAKSATILAATSVLGIAPGVNAQEAPVQGAADAELQEVVITGSHIRTGVGEQIARPVDVVSADDIAKLGPQKLVDALRQEPAFTGAVATAGAGPSSGGRSTVNLRGLGEKYTLVLVNGRRFNAVDAANINEIPSGAVSGIEVLKDGSSSVYGSDAVAGVVNILLDTKFEGLEITSSYGNTFGHDATEIKGSLKFGVAGERGRLVTNVHYRDRNGTSLYDMELGRVLNTSDLGGIETNRYYTSPAIVILPSGDSVVLDYNRFGIGEYSTNPADYIPYDRYDYNRSEFNRRERQLFTDRAPERQVGLFAYGEYDLVPERATLFTEAIFSTGKLRNGYVTWGLDFYGDPVTDFGPVPASNPWNPFGVDLRDVQYAVPEVGQYFEAYETDTFRVVNGLRGVVGRLEYEVGATYFRSEETMRQENLYSSRGLLEAINRPGLDAFNPFCNGCNTPEQLAGIRVPNNEVDTTNTQTIFDAKLTGPLREGEHYDLAFAAGLEYRSEEYDYQPDPYSLTGDIYYIQLSPDHRKRNAKAVFGEIGYTLRGSEAGLPAMHRLTAELSGRFEQIGDVGDTFNPRIAFAWSPLSDAFTLRASYGTSFNAPPIDLLRADQVLVNAVLFYPDLGQEIPTDVLEGGNPDLEPETATSINLGMMFEPSGVPGLRFIVDYFDVDQKDVVVVPDPQAIANGTIDGEIDFSGVRPRIVAVATNIAGRRINGFDFTMDYSRQTESAGTWGFEVGGSYMTKFESDDGSGFVSWLGSIGEVGGTFGEFGALPRLRGRAALRWANATGMDAELAFNHVGSFKDGDGVTRDVEAFDTVDLNFGYDMKAVVPGLAVQLGLLNVFDEEPPFSNWWRFSSRYDASTASSLGRFGFVSMKYAF